MWLREHKEEVIFVLVCILALTLFFGVDWVSVENWLGMRWCEVRCMGEAGDPNIWEMCMGSCIKSLQ